MLEAMGTRDPALEQLLDQPHVVAGAGEALQAAGMADRCRIIGGSFFESVPDGGDAYVLKLIIHDWEDADVTAILRSCRRAVGSDGRLLLIERELGPPNEGLAGKLMDLQMLVGAGGRERASEEYAALFAAAGFRLVDVVPSAAGWYGLRAWIEQGFKITKRGGWQWQRTRMNDPDRAARLWLAVAVATLWLLSVGGAAEAAASDGIPESTLLDVTASLALGRRQRHATRPRVISLFRRGLTRIWAARLARQPLPTGRYVPDPWPTMPSADHGRPTPPLPLPYRR
jgi:hypothetical protein